MRKNLGWFALTAFWTLTGLAAIIPAIMMPMMFDAPGSQTNPLVLGLAL